MKFAKLHAWYKTIFTNKLLKETVLAKAQEESKGANAKLL